MQDRDISKDKDLLAKQGSKSRFMDTRQSITSAMSRASTPSRSNTPGRNQTATPAILQHLQSSVSGSTLQIPGASDPTYADFKKRVYSNYEFLLEQENSQSPNGKQQVEIVANICTMIKRNKSLLHLDLSHTHLTEYMLWNIGKALSRARSVISVHLSGNRGITPTLKD